MFLIHSSRARIAGLLVLVVALLFLATSQNTRAAGGRRLLPPLHQNEQAYKALFEASKSSSRYLQSFTKVQNMPTATSLPGNLRPHAAVRAAASLVSGAASPSIASGTRLVPSGHWTSVGPTPLDTSQGDPTYVGPYGPNSGRTTGIVVDPTTSGASTTIYIATVGGGIWKSVNNGVSWQALTDNMPLLMMGAIAMDPHNHLVLYAGTGEFNVSGDSGYGVGLYKTVDGGKTWKHIGQSTFTSTAANGTYKIGKIAVDPRNSAVVWVVSNRGLFRSVNGGTTWALMPVKVGTTTISLPPNDLVLDETTSPTTIYVTLSGILQGNAGAGIYRSVNGGSVWTDLTTNFNPPIDRTTLGRTVIAQARSNRNVLYMMASSPALDPTSGDLQLAYKTTNRGATWTPIFQPATATFYPYLGSVVNQTAPTDPCSADGAYGFQGQCWYDIYIGVDPNNANLAYFGGVDTARTLDGGKTFVNITNVYNPFTPGPVHPDQHGIAFGRNFTRGPITSVYFANDGGVYSSTDAGNSYANLNTNLATLEVYYTSGGTNYANQHLLWNGMQDNGTARYTGNAMWAELFGGDGGFTAIDPTDQRVVYEEYVFANINKTTDAGATWNGATNGLPAEPSGDTDTKYMQNAALFIAPFQIDPEPANHLHLVLGEDAVFETVDGAANWCQISQVFSGDPLGSGQSVSAVSIAPSTSAAGAETIYAGLQNGKVFKTTAGYVTPNSPCAAPLAWTEVDSGLPGGFVTDIAVDRLDANTAYVTYALNDASVALTPGPHVFMTTDGGTTWNAIDGTGVTGLPDTNFNSIVTYSTTTGAAVIAGGDLGAYVTTDSGATWSALKQGLPNSPIYKLRMDFGQTTLIASTHGRSVFTMPIPESSPTAGTGDTVGLFHPNFNTVAGNFLFRYSLTSGPADLQTNMGATSDIGIVGDWNGDGISTVGTFRPGTNQFVLKDSNAPIAPVAYSFVFGFPGDIPVVGDWNHSGHDSIGVYRPSTGRFYLRNSLSAGPVDSTIAFLGMPAGARPVIGDFDGDGFDTVGIFLNGQFTYTNQVCKVTFCMVSTSGTFAFGQAGDLPLSGDWLHTGKSGIGVYRPSNGTFYLRTEASTGVPDYTLVITGGAPTDLPVAGHFNSTGSPISSAPVGGASQTTPSTPEVAPTFVPTAK